MKSLRPTTVVALMMACLSPDQPALPTYDAVGSAVGRFGNPSPDQCAFLARLALPTPLPTYWEGRVALYFSRTLVRAGKWTDHDTTYSEWATFRRSGTDSVALTLEGPIT